MAAPRRTPRPKPKKPPAWTGLAASTAALAATVERKPRPCLGPGAVERPHLYTLSTPSCRVCPACRDRQASMCVSARMAEPLRTHGGEGV